MFKDTFTPHLFIYPQLMVGAQQRSPHTESKSTQRDFNWSSFLILVDIWTAAT